MDTQSPPLVMYCSCPDLATAERIATCVVGERLAACVNIVGPDLDLSLARRSAAR